MGMFDRFKNWMNEPDPDSYEPPMGIPAPDQERDLALYKFDSCPFCQRVLHVVRDKELDAIELVDTRRDAAARDHLFEETGRTTVPCLFVDGVPFFESADIKAWLQVYAARGFGQTS